MTRKILALPAAAIGALALAGSAIASPPADVPPVPLPVPELVVSIDPAASLAANRVVARVPVTVTCRVPESGGADVSVTLTQAVGGRIAHGYGSVEDLPCDGRPHAAQVDVVAAGGGAPFRAGHAAVQANVFACEAGRVEDPNACRYVSTPPQDIVLLPER